MPSYCFSFKIPDDLTATNTYTYFQLDYSPSFNFDQNILNFGNVNFASAKISAILSGLSIYQIGRYIHTFLQSPLLFYFRDKIPEQFIRFIEFSHAIKYRQLKRMLLLHFLHKLEAKVWKIGKLKLKRKKSQVKFSKISAQPLKRCQKKQCKVKLNYRKQVFFFALNFLPWEFLLIKKLEIRKTKTTQYTYNP